MTEKAQKGVSDNSNTGKRKPMIAASPRKPLNMLEYHEYANIFPMFSDADFNDLVENIRKNGLRDKIVLLNGRILDGRNRYRALLELGIFSYTVHCVE